jgi:hypothetical protein
MDFGAPGTREIGGRGAMRTTTLAGRNRSEPSWRTTTPPRFWPGT